jgi:hypothetical protein
MRREAEVENPVRVGVLTGYLHAQIANRTSDTRGKTPASPVTVVAGLGLGIRVRVLDEEDAMLLKLERKLCGIVREENRVLRKASFPQIHRCRGLKVTTRCLYHFRGTDL